MGKNVQKSRYWAFVIYPEDSAPSNWKDILSEFHLPMAISPLHDKDLNADGEEKKVHRHVLVCYGNTTTGTNIQCISDSVHGTNVIPVFSLKGYYRYLTHKDNPEKAQYQEKDIISLAGFDPSDYWSYTQEEEVKLTLVIQGLIKEYRIIEYFGLLEFLSGYDLALYRFVCNKTLLFREMVTSYKRTCRMKDSDK